MCLTDGLSMPQNAEAASFDKELEIRTSIRKLFLISFPSLTCMPDQDITCRDCGAVFTFTEGEQEFYATKDLSAPQRCKACRAARKNQRGGGGGDREMHDAVCAQCGAQCQVPFKPRPVEEGGKPVLCKECFSAKRGGAM